MVFSFFKKPPEKMVARPAVVPRPASDENAVAPGAAKSAAGDKSHAAPPHASADPSPSALEGADFVFSESSPDFQIEGNIDPVDAEAEEAAVLYANGQDEAARAVLENAVSVHTSGAGERLWLMLFDLYRLCKRQADFDKLANDYANTFKKAAPPWSGRVEPARAGKPKLQVVPPAPVRVPEPITGALVFEGDLVGSNGAAFERIRQALANQASLRVDLARVGAVDCAGCARLLGLLQAAAKAKRSVELLGRDTLGALVERQVEPGRAENQDCWLLLLELCQLQGEHEAFEEIAIDYAVTFEVSPPSWEKERVAAPEPVREWVTIESTPPPSPAEPEVHEEIAADAPPSPDAYVLSGEIKATRFGDLPAHAEKVEALVVECTALTRMDFISAGALLNVLSRIRVSGKQIVFRHPNHLVAELFGVVGLTAIATVVFARS